MIPRATLLLIAVVLAAAQKDPHWLDGRNTIVHLFEWKFSDIAAECERFLGPYGYAGVQTSPINEYMCMPYYNHPWWERYQPISYIIYSRSGDEEAFADMVRRCNNVGVRIYVDIILNHMSGDVQVPVGCAGSTSDPPNRIYPDYGPDDFHTQCSIDDYNDKYQVRNCELDGLHDLDQSRPGVRRTLIDFLNKLVDHGVAGFRVDAAKHMWPEDLEYIYGTVKDLNTAHGFQSGSRPFFYQEVVDTTLNEGVHNYEYTSFGVVTEFRYGSELKTCFGDDNLLKWLQNWGPDWALLPSEDALAFISNHDNQRGNGGVLTYKESRPYKMATAFMLAWPYGVTRIMSSYYFTDTSAGPPADEDFNILDVAINSDLTCGNGWVCEHRWRQIFNMIAFKNTVAGTTVNDWWDNGSNQIAFCRGGSGFIAFNKEDNTDLQKFLQTCLPQGIYCDLISGSKYNNSCSGKSVEVGSDGIGYIEILATEDNGVLSISIDSKL